MRTALILGIGTLIVACGSAPADEAQSGQAELQTVSTNGGPTCNGWTCSAPAQRAPVADAEFFTFLRKYEPAGSNPSIVEGVALECAEIVGSCQPPSCTLHTSCGGGGPLSGDDALVADGWLQGRHVPQQTASFATRRSVVDIACEQQPVTGGVACTFRASGGDPSSSSGSPTH